MSESEDPLDGLPRAEPRERILLPVDLYDVVAPQREYLLQAFREWKIKLRPRGSNPLAEAILRDLKDEYLRLERIETRALALWAETVIRVTAANAESYVEKLWNARLADEAGKRTPPPIPSREAAAEAERLAGEDDYG